MFPTRSELRSSSLVNTARASVLEGPHLPILLFVLAVAVGVLTGLGAQSWSRHLADLRPIDPPSRAASDLGYRRAADFQADSREAEAALRRVLAGGPGTQRLWENAETGNRGVIWGHESRATAASPSCLHLERRTLLNGTYANAWAMVCDSRAPLEQIRWQTQ